MSLTFYVACFEEKKKKKQDLSKRVLILFKSYTASQVNNGSIDNGLAFFINQAYCEDLDTVAVIAESVVLEVMLKSCWIKGFRNIYKSIKEKSEFGKNPIPSIVKLI